MSCPGLLVHIVEEPGAGATVLAEPGGVVLALSPDRLRARSALLALIEALDAGTPGGSYLLGDDPRDARAFALEQAWQSLRLWDFEHVVARLLVAAPWAKRLLFPGRSCLRYFSGRGALRAALSLKEARCGASAEVCSLAYWASPGFGQLLDLEELPCVDPASTTILVVPPPSSFFRAIAAMSSPARRRVLTQSSSDILDVSTTGRLEAAVARAAKRLGVALLCPARREDLRCRLIPPRPGSTLMIIAHQDSAGVHFTDGVMSMDELGFHWNLALQSSEAAYSTVDLGVCGSEEPGNLAEQFQAAGAPVVMSRGPHGFYGRELANLVLVLEHLERHGPSPLPRIVDEVWRAAFRPAPEDQVASRAELT